MATQINKLTSIPKPVLVSTPTSPKGTAAKPVMPLVSSMVVPGLGKVAMGGRVLAMIPKSAKVLATQKMPDGTTFTKYDLDRDGKADFTLMQSSGAKAISLSKGKFDYFFESDESGKIWYIARHNRQTNTSVDYFDNNNDGRSDAAYLSGKKGKYSGQLNGSADLNHDGKIDQVTNGDAVHRAFDKVRISSLPSIQIGANIINSIPATAKVVSEKTAKGVRTVGFDVNHDGVADFNLIQQLDPQTGHPVTSELKSTANGSLKNAPFDIQAGLDFAVASVDFHDAAGNERYLSAGSNGKTAVETITARSGANTVYTDQDADGIADWFTTTRKVGSTAS